MKVGNVYTLNISVDEFFDKTWKKEFCVFLRENKGECRPDKVESGESFDSAYFNHGNIVLELTSDLWKYFDLVIESSHDSTQGGEYHAVTKTPSPSNVLAFNPVSSKQAANDLTIDFDTAHNLTAIHVHTDYASDETQLLRFAVEHVFKAGSKYEAHEIENTESMVSKIIELEKLDRTIEALENMSRLIDTELERVHSLVMTQLQ